MAATKTTDRDFNVQVLQDTVRGVMRGKTALVDSILASSGGIVVNSAMTADRNFIGNEITVPYFGTIGDFVTNAEDNAVTPVTLKTTNEKATVGRSSLAFEVTKWAQNSGPMDADPYEECAQQIRVAARREMDRLCVAAAAATPMVRNVYSASSPVYLDWDLVTDGRAMWGDEQEDIVGMVVHSQVESGLRKLRDDMGRPLLLDSMVNGSTVTRFNNIPLVVSDRAPLTGSSMGSVTETGAVVGNVTLSGTPTGPWDLRIDIITGGSRGTATFKFSTDGGNTWSAELTTAATVALTDTAADSLVGNNGATGITAAFGVATYDAASVYSAKAVLKASSLIIQRGALAFWYNANAMDLKTLPDILKDNDVAAMHLYRVAHLYRRRRGGTRPGVVSLVHNVPGWT